MNNGVGIPMVGIIGLGAWGFDARPALVSGGVEHLFLLQELGDLHRSPSFHAQLEDSLHYHSRRFVHDPLGFVLRVFNVPKRHINRQRYATRTLCFLYSPDFAARILGEKFIKPVFDTGNIAVCAVGVDGVKAVVDGNIPHIVLRESEVDIKPGQRGISSQSG